MKWKIFQKMSGQLLMFSLQLWVWQNLKLLRAPWDQQKKPTSLVSCFFADIINSVKQKRNKLIYCLLITHTHKKFNTSRQQQKPNIIHSEIKKVFFFKKTPSASIKASNKISVLLLIIAVHLLKPNTVVTLGILTNETWKNKHSSSDQFPQQGNKVKAIGI